MTIGVVLCGGLSTRMKADKGTFVFNDTTFLERTYKVVNSCFSEVVVSINSSQQETYLDTFPNYNFVVDNLEHKGPINGILSVHKKYPEADLLIVPCDMINIDKSLLVNIESSNSQVYEEVGIQPFPMFITSGKLREISNCKLDRYSLRYIIEKFSISTKSIAPDIRFFNANSQSDL